MTFPEAVTAITTEHLPDYSAERYGLDVIVGALNAASEEVASAYRLGRSFVSTTLNATGELTLTSEQASGVYALEDVTAGGYRLARKDSVTATLYAYVSGPPRYYVWEPIAPTALTVLPAPSGNVPLKLTTLRTMPKGSVTGTTVTGDAIWYGAYAPFHDLVVWKAAKRLFDAERLFEESAQYEQRAQQREAEFAGHLQGLGKDVVMRMQMTGAQG